MGVQGGPGVLNPPGRSQGDAPSLLIIDRRRDKLHDFISLQVCCALLQEGWLLAGLERRCRCAHEDTSGSPSALLFLFEKQNERRTQPE